MRMVTAGLRRRGLLHLLSVALLPPSGSSSSCDPRHSRACHIGVVADTLMVAMGCEGTVGRSKGESPVAPSPALPSSIVLMLPMVSAWLLSSASRASYCCVALITYQRQRSSRARQQGLPLPGAGYQDTGIRAHLFYDAL
eukprot:scaffold185_cov321-Prasinococcus_capsulatus_cf.AAC.7